MASERWQFPEPLPDWGDHNGPGQGQGRLKAVRLKELTRSLKIRNSIFVRVTIILKTSPSVSRGKYGEDPWIWNTV